MGRDDIYAVRMSKVDCYCTSAVATDLWTSLLDIHHPDQWHSPVAATTVFSAPDDGRRKRPKHVD